MKKLLKITEITTLPIFHNFSEISRQIALRSGRAGSSVLNDLANPKMVIKNYLNFFRFFISERSERSSY